MLPDFDDFLAKYEVLIARSLVIVVILAVAWYSFLELLAVPVDAASALIMVWLSASVLIVALFPNILDRVKRVKIGDFEFELQEIVAEAKKEFFNPVSEYGQDEMIFTEKGNLRTLERILRLSFFNPLRPILLVVNVYPGNVSLPMLVFYLYFLNLFGNNVIVLFTSQQRKVTDVSQISITALIGILSGTEILQTFYRSFPESFKVLQALPEEGLNREADNYSGSPIPSAIFLSRGFGHFLNRFEAEASYRRVSGDDRENHEPNLYPLSKSDIISWFGPQLDTSQISRDFSPSDIRTVREAITKGDEFIALSEENHLVAVLALCGLSSRISIKALEALNQ